jgi:hypothetical protein
LSSKLRGEQGKLGVQSLEPRLLRVGQLSAAEPEVAQLVRHDAALCGLERGERRCRGKLAIACVEPQVLREVGVERRHRRQRRVISLAPLRVADDRVEMVDGSPRSGSIRSSAPASGSATASHVAGRVSVTTDSTVARADSMSFCIAGTDVLGADQVEAGQPS